MTFIRFAIACAFASGLIALPPSAAAAQGAVAVQQLGPTLALGVLPTPLMFGRDREPSSGMTQIVIGYIGLGLGVLNLALIPVCFADVYPSEAKDLCVGLSIGFGAVGLAVGIPLLIVGYNKRADRHAWRRRRGLSYYLSNLHLAALSGGGLLSYRGSL